jgi:hypothetical protein
MTKLPVDWSIMPFVLRLPTRAMLIYIPRDIMLAFPTIPHSLPWGFASA